MVIVAMSKSLRRNRFGLGKMIEYLWVMCWIFIGFGVTGFCWGYIYPRFRKKKRYQKTINEDKIYNSFIKK